MDQITAIALLGLLLVGLLAGLLLPKERPPRPPDHIHHVWDTRRD